MTDIQHRLWGRGEIVPLPVGRHVELGDLWRFHLDGYRVTVDTSKGGSVVSLLHRGVELLSDVTFGDQLQLACFGPRQSDPQHSNPTQAGAEGMEDGLWRASPILVRGVPRPNTYVVEVSPLDWYRRDAAGMKTPGGSHAVIWRDLILGMMLEFDYLSISGLIRCESTIRVPGAVHVELGVYHALPALCCVPPLTRQWSYDAQRDIAADRTDYIAAEGAAGRPPRFMFPSQNGIGVVNYGGPILASDDGQHAIGLFGVGDEVGGCNTRSIMMAFPGRWKPGGQPAPAYTAALRVERTPLAAGENVFVTWICVGTLKEVKALMRRMAGPWPEQGGPR